MNPDQANASYGLPKMSDIYSNIQAPSLSDIGGSLGNKADTLNSGPSNAFKSYAGFAQGLQKPQDYYQSLLEQNGIPQLQHTSETLQGNVNNLEEAINRVPTDVSNNTANSLTTESQRNGMVNAKQYPLGLELNPLLYGLGQVNTSLATQEQNIGNEVGAMNTGNEQQLGVGAMGVNVAADNAARSLTGYTSDAENMLQGLLKKMDIQGNLDAQEWSTLSQLAEQKQAYTQKLGEINAQNQADIKVQQVGHQYIPLSAGQTLVNTLNGGTYRAR